MSPLTAEIWSDIVCPWCYIGEHRFERALARFAHRDQVEVVRRSFQLDQSAPRNSQVRVIDMLSSKYGVNPAQAAQMEQRVVGLAAAEGLPMRSDRFVVNTFDAHRLLHLAAAHGRQDRRTTVVRSGRPTTRRPARPRFARSSSEVSNPCTDHADCTDYGGQSVQSA